jgi:hypothetical protein
VLDSRVDVGDLVVVDSSSVDVLVGRLVVVDSSDVSDSREVVVSVSRVVVGAGVSRVVEPEVTVSVSRVVGNVKVGIQMVLRRRKKGIISSALSASTAKSPIIRAPAE